MQVGSNFGKWFGWFDTQKWNVGMVGMGILVYG